MLTEYFTLRCFGSRKNSTAHNENDRSPHLPGISLFANDGNLFSLNAITPFLKSEQTSGTDFNRCIKSTIPNGNHFGVGVAMLGKHSAKMMKDRPVKMSCRTTIATQNWKTGTIESEDDSFMLPQSRQTAGRPAGMKQEAIVAVDPRNVAAVCFFLRVFFFYTFHRDASVCSRTGACVHAFAARWLHVACKCCLLSDAGAHRKVITPHATAHRIVADIWLRDQLE